ncbi:uncharacterized protein LOC136035503 isoform X2 [Artemia franciscana]
MNVKKFFFLESASSTARLQADQAWQDWLITQGEGDQAWQDWLITHGEVAKSTIRLKLFVGTYNVNGKSPPTSLSDWLSCDDEPPDMYAIGFQELDLSKEAYVFKDNPKEEEWLRAVLAGIHPKAKYRKVKLIRLVGIMLIVLVQERFAAYIRGVSAETVGTGFLGKVGNKGGVGVRFELHNTSVCIVNCHLAAHIEEIERRFQDYHDICERMSFPPAKTIKDHNLVFWFGDLNYRLTGIEGQAAKDLIDTANYEQLFMFDQLREQKRIKRVFDGYQEGIPNFRPTYKYDTGTDNWDSSKKNRAPAWTDRILWKADGVDQIVYRSHPSLKISDHKPVSSLFEIPIAVICSVEVATISNTGQTNERAIAKNLINKFERWEAEDEKENRPNQRQSHLSLYEEEGIEHSLESTRDFKARFEAWNNQRTTPVNEQKSRTKTNERAIAKNLINKFERWEAEDEKENRPNQRQSHLSLYEEEGIEHSLESTRDFKARFEAWNNQRTTPVNEQKSRTKTNERAIAKNLINKFERWEAEVENENRLNQRLSHLSLYEEEGIEHSLESTRDIKARFEAWNNQRTTPVNEQKSRTK